MHYHKQSILCPVNEGTEARRNKQVKQINLNCLNFENLDKKKNNLVVIAESGVENEKCAFCRKRVLCNL